MDKAGRIEDLDECVEAVGEVVYGDRSGAEGGGRRRLLRFLDLPFGFGVSKTSTSGKSNS